MLHLDDDDLKNIAKFMALHGSQSSNIQAGLTYIGQMISHDIVPPTNPKPGGRFVTPALNLDSVYGDSPPPDIFPLREVIDADFGVTNYDLNRKDGIATVPEHRNDENIIISQLHAFWQRLHNYLVEKLQFDASNAREYTIKTFQLIVIEEFLSEVLDGKVYQAYFSGGNRFLPNRETNQIPSFFSFAAFRFGHSMVRNSYRIRNDDNVPDRSLLKLFNGGKALPQHLAIDWNDFFGADSQKALKIDMGFSRKMREVNFPIDSPSEIDVLFRNLKAGQFASLPSGHEFCDYLDWYNRDKEAFAELDLKKLTEYSADLKPLAEDVSIDQLPLWPYLLTEAEMKPNNGQNLGVLGSILVADVLHQSVSIAEHSVIANGHYDFYSAIDSMSQGNWGEALSAGSHTEDAKLTMDHLISIIK